MKICNVKICDKTVKAVGLCNGHYERERLNRKKPMELPINGWNSSGITATDVNDYRQQWYKLRGVGSIKEMHKLRFGDLREVTILRDKEKCVMCGMTRKQHKLTFDRDITVNHIDHQSKRSNGDNFYGIPNNDLNNLETLCLRCHGAIDAIKHGRSSKYLLSLQRRVVK